MLHEDDRLHDAGTDDAFFEAYWFAFYVPEQRLTVYAYPWFRPNLGTYGGGVLAWDDRGNKPWTIVHHDYSWARRFDGEASMVDGTTISTPQGVIIDCLSANEAYRIRYDNPALAFDVTYTATGAGSQTAASTGEQDIFKGHIDQPGRYVGKVRVADTWYDVDCHCVRDRSWGPRPDNATGMHVGYYHATAGAQDAFLMVGHEHGNANEFDLLPGYLIRDGEQSRLVEARATITRSEELSPATCRIDAKDELGRTLVAEGESIAAVALQQQPGMFNWSSLATWRFNGIEAHGELQDTWHPDKYRAFARGTER